MTKIFKSSHPAVVGVFLILVMMASMLGGCSDHGDPAGVMDPPEVVDPISFASDIQVVFDTNCIGCHGAGGNAGMDLRSDFSYANLVGVAASNSSGNRVEAGDPSGSVLYQRLTATMAGPMPPDGVLQSEIQDLVAQWITEGALNN